MKGAETAPFSAMLEETMAEMDAAEAAEAALEADPLERFRLATQQAVLAGAGGALPRQGHKAYIKETVQSTDQNRRHLDILS